MDESFNCIYCGREVGGTATGTLHRNHCPYCLWSQHLDKSWPGDRLANCGGDMQPLGLTFKREGGEVGELCVVNRCKKCGITRKNRLSGDDDSQAILAIYRKSLENNSGLSGVDLLDSSAEREIITQLFGRPYAEKYFATPR